MSFIRSPSTNTATRTRPTTSTTTHGLIATASLTVVLHVSERPHLKKRYQRRVEKVKEYLKTVKDFEELVSPQSLFLHLLGPKPSSKVVKKNLASRGDVSKDDLVVTPPPAHSPAKRPTSPTSSLEVIASIGEETKKKKKVGGKSFLPSFWDDADTAALKAYEALSVDDLNPLMAKSSSEVMSSHIQRLVQGNLCLFLGSFWT
nr:hypothetical protein CFP56_43282 [Quercus suber]